MGNFRTGLIFLASLFTLALVASPAMAAPTLEIDGTTTFVALGPYLDVLDDPTGRFELSDVTRPEIAARFTPFQGSLGPNDAYTSSTLWARFAVENVSDVPIERWIVVDLAFIEHIEVFRDGEPPALQGALEPRANRELPRRTYSFRLRLAPHQTRLVHARSWGFAEVELPLQLREIGALGNADRKLAALSALGLGVLLAMALYNAFLFLYVRDRSHLYYAGYTVASGLWSMSIDGSLLELTPAGVRYLPHWVNIVTIYGAMLLAGMFVRSVLGLRASRPRFDRAVLATMGILAAVGLIYLLGLIDYRVENIAARPVIVCSILVWIVAAGVRWRRDGLSTGLYVLVAWAALFAVTLIVQLGLFGLVEMGTAPPMSIGYAVEAILLSLALANATRERAKQVEERGLEVAVLNEELRHQVAERSRELTDALARSEGTVTPAQLEIGDAFDGRYRVLSALGRGGMGAVYEVARLRDDRRLALKVITAPLSAKRAARFAREAEIGSRLHHENLVSIVDVGIAAGSTPFLVMELVNGGSLEDQRSRFGDPAWALPILRQIAAGLAELHLNAVVHRDLKPGNVLLVEGRSGTSTAKISDFGISRFGALDEGSEVDVDGATVLAHGGAGSPRELTQTGALLGTPLYMPPEAWHEPARQPSADLFSFGLLAYEMITGRSAFAVPPVLLERSGQPIPVPPPVEGTGTDIAEMVLACLRVAPQERPRAKDLVAALAGAARGRVATSRP